MRSLLLLTLCIWISVVRGQLQITTTTTEGNLKKWTGPLADHRLGVHPSDTAEVAAAKEQLLAAYKDALTILPVLPPEERYIKEGLPLASLLAVQKQAQEQILAQVKAHHLGNPAVLTNPEPPLAPLIPTTSPTTILTVLAEDIPRSPLGEVPEVYAARLAHLRAIQEAKAAAAAVQPAI